MGRAIQNMIQIPSDDKIRTVIDVPQLEDEEFINTHFVVLCTKKGIIKKTKLADFSRPRANGIIAITIEEGDQLLDVSLTMEDYYIMMAVKSGRAICFPQEKVRATGRGAIGVFGIELNENDDEVIGMICVAKNDVNKQILVVSENGLGKRTPFWEKVEKDTTAENGAEATDSDPDNVVDIGGEKYLLSYRVTNRGGKGVKTINVTEKTGGLIGLLGVETTDDLMITCESGVTIRMKVSAIREAGRATQGVKLINIDEGDKIAAIARIAEQENDDEQEAEGEAGEGGADAPANDAPAAETE
jgi:DNA gyrase subunit A